MRIHLAALLLLVVPYAGVGQTKDALALLEWASSTRHSHLRVSLDSLRSCATYYSQKQEAENAAACLCLLSVIQLEQLNNMQDALASVSEIKTLALQKNKTHLFIDYYNQLGVLYYNNEVDMHKAFLYFKKALYLQKALPSSYHADKLLSNYGLAFLHANQPTQARYWFRKALQTYTSKYHKKGTPAYFHNIGVSFIQEGNIDSAAYYLKEAWTLSTQTPGKKDDAEAQMSLGIFYQETGNNQAALNNLLNAYGNFRYLPAYTSRILVCQGIADAYAEMGSYGQAYAFRTKERNYKDALRRVNLAEQALRYEQRTKTLHHQKERENWRKQLAVTLLLFLAVVVVLLTLLFRIRAARKRERISSLQKIIAAERLNMEVKEKEQELAVKQHFILEKDQLISQLTEQLQESLEALEIGRQENINTTIDELKHTRIANRWEEFELRFNKVHPEFFKNLDERYSNLTNNERKLSAYLVMDMTTKDISALTGQSPHSINIARGRLRKQLGITHTNEDVHAFLRGFLEKKEKEV